MSPVPPATSSRRMPAPRRQPVEQRLLPQPVDAARSSGRSSGRSARRPASNTSRTRPALCVRRRPRRSRTSAASRSAARGRRDRSSARRLAERGSAHADSGAHRGRGDAGVQAPDPARQPRGRRKRSVPCRSCRRSRPPCGRWRARLAGRRITGARAAPRRHPLPAAAAPRRAAGRPAAGPGFARRAKYIQCFLDDGQALLLHLGMSGRLLFDGPPARPARASDLRLRRRHACCASSTRAASACSICGPTADLERAPLAGASRP